MAHTELVLFEKRGIEGMLNAKMPVSEHGSPIYRAIKRNPFTENELPYLTGLFG